MPTLSRDGDVFVLNLGDGENRFSPDFLDGVAAALDEVEAAPAPRALVTTATQKIWSNGLDLDWMGANQSEIPAMVGRVQELYARFLGGNFVAVAALQGHTFAAGAMLALAHDERVMREDRGWWCLPEADINIPFTPGMNALVVSRLTPQAAHQAMVTAHRFPGPDALAAGIVDELAAEGDVLVRAIERAQAHAAKDPGTLATIKGRLYEPALAKLRDPDVGFG